jgi:hypothetical protein
MGRYTLRRELNPKVCTVIPENQDMVTGLVNSQSLIVCAPTIIEKPHVYTPLDARACSTLCTQPLALSSLACVTSRELRAPATQHHFHVSLFQKNGAMQRE